MEKRLRHMEMMNRYETAGRVFQPGPGLGLDYTKIRQSGYSEKESGQLGLAVGRVDFESPRPRPGWT